MARRKRGVEIRPSIESGCDRGGAVIVSAMTQGQKNYIVEINNNDIVFCCGPAGTGKTAVAVGMGLQAICSADSAYDRLVVLRPAKEAFDERIGFLPGTAADKMEGWAAPVVDNMNIFIDRRQIRNLFMEGRVEVIPMCFIRGRSLNKSWIIVDEAQNTTPQQMLAILTRIGMDSKMCINGDLAQSDIRTKSGLSDAMDRLRDIPGISFCRMGSSDIVRHPLIAEISRRYEEDRPAS